jgi:hypothetical protein
MASVRLIFAAATGQFEAALKEQYKPIARAATAAIRDAGDQAKAEARANFLAAGLGQGQANALRVNAYPKGSKVSADAGAFLFHRTTYGAVFEDGATIAGRPLLWVPLPNVPQKIGRKRMTPALYRERIGNLRYVNPPGGRPLLVADVRLSKSRAGAQFGNVSAAALRRGAGGTGVLKSVPVFIGLSTVQIQGRLQIRKICGRARDRLPALYFKHFRDA